MSHTLMARDYKGIGNQEMTAVILKCSELTSISGGEEREIANTVKAKYDAGVTNFRQDGTAVCVRIN